MAEKRTTDTTQKGDGFISNSFAFAWGETFFVLLPFIVILIALAFKEGIHHVFYEPEWSIVASVIFGQSIVKLIHAAGLSKDGFNPYRMGFWVSAIILIGLVPSLTVLSLMITSNIEIRPLWMVVLQMVLFLIAMVSFFIVNAIHASMED